MRSYCPDDQCLCFRKCQWLVFPQRRPYTGTFLFLLIMNIRKISMSHFRIFLRNMLQFVLLLVVFVDCRRIVDLTHTLDKNTPKLPLSGFGVTNMTYYKREVPMEKYVNADTWIALGVVEFYEHTGTHIDAPFHFGNGRQRLHEIPTNKMVGPGVVIDVKDKANDNIDYAVLVEDILEYENKFGRIPVGAIVMMNSGSDKKYPDENQVFGTDDVKDFSTFHYPGFSLEACEFLHQQRQISVFGSDSPSIDSPKLSGMACHKYLQPLDVPLLEYVANLDSIPQNGTTIVLGIPKIRDASGAPTRILAFVDDDDDVTNASSNPIAGFFSFVLVIVFRLISLD